MSFCQRVKRLVERHVWEIALPKQQRIERELARMKREGEEYH
jgi:hypothetical protein